MQKESVAHTALSPRAAARGLGILLVQLGPPDAPTSQALRPYLRQFLSDPRVMVYVPARWVAALRAADAHGNEVMFRAELGPGAHRGPSGRWSSLTYEAELCAWVIDVAHRPRPRPPVAPGGS